MVHRQRRSPDGGRRDWVAPEHAARSRPWAYEELLFGPSGETRRAEELNALAADLACDLAELRRLHGEVLDEIVRTAGLEGQLRAHVQSPEPFSADREREPRADEVELRSFPSERAPGEREPVVLTRCEGFRVDSPEGTIGIVEGLRFASRIDQPDLLEVRGGRFGRQLLLIPVEAVEAVSPDDERLVLRSAPRTPEDPVHELVSRIRRVLS